MNRRLIVALLLVTALLLAIGWHFATSSPEVETVASQSGQVAASRADLMQTDTASSAVVLKAKSTVSDSRDPVSGQAGQEHAQSRELFAQLLRDYSSGELTQDEKILIEKSLRELNQQPLGRNFIIDTFFSSDDPQLATALYNLMLDADLKDVALLEGLIQRDSSEPGMDSKHRLVDLIADLAAQDHSAYSPAIEEYLLQMSLHPDTRLRNAAVTQRIWYLAQHQPDDLATLGEYLLDPAPRVREEMYSLIRARADKGQLSGQAELTLALEAVLQADYLDLSAQEQDRIRSLLTTLTDR